MGLKNGVAIFQRVIEYCLQGVADIADPYVDDIIIGTIWQGSREATLKAHDRDVRRVLEALKRHKLVADSWKCKFFVEEVEFCGHILGKGLRRPAPGKLMALEKWEEPRTVTALRGFFGFTNYYSSYVPNYANIVACLMDLLKVDKVEGKKGSKKPATFTEQHRQAFRTVRDTLLSELLLHTVKPDRPYVLRVDASDRAIGAALEQFADDDPHILHALDKERDQPAFRSRKFTPVLGRPWTPREEKRPIQ